MRLTHSFWCGVLDLSKKKISGIRWVGRTWAGIIWGGNRKVGGPLSNEALVDMFGALSDETLVDVMRGLYPMKPWLMYDMRGLYPMKPW